MNQKNKISSCDNDDDCEVSSSTSTLSSYKERCEQLCNILATHGGANHAATIIEEAGKYGYDYMIPNVHRTNWSRRLALLCTIAMSGIVTTVVLINSNNNNNKKNNYS